MSQVGSWSSNAGSGKISDPLEWKSSGSSALRAVRQAHARVFIKMPFLHMMMLVAQLRESMTDGAHADWRGETQ